MGAYADPTPSPGSRGAGLTPEQRTDLRYAMLSVYYGSLAKELQSRGAPAVLMPVQVRPMSLDDALHRIAQRFPDRLRDAVWRVVRSVPPPRSPDADIMRYPAALRQVLEGTPLDLAQLDSARWDKRSGSNLLATALLARIDGRKDEFDQLRTLLAASPPAMSGAMQEMLGVSANDMLVNLEDDDEAQRLRLLERVGDLNISDYVSEFADAGAFLECWPPDPGPAMTVYPTSCFIVQDAWTLVTTVTSTVLVSCEDFSTLARAVDPQCWACSSDVVTGSRYVRDPYDLRSLEPVREPGGGFEPDEQTRYLAEDVTVRWGVDDTRVGGFHNVLRIDGFEVDENAQKIDLRFALARSIDSRILWDGRPGGILVDQGFMKVRPMADDRWRFISRKVVLFSDRSPNAGATGSIDFGQMLNYLTPAALSWWLEGELSSAADEIYSDAARVLEFVESHASGGADG